MHTFSIIIITETCLKYSNQNIYNLDNYNYTIKLILCDLNVGVAYTTIVAICILNSLSYTIMNDLNRLISNVIEISTISWKFNNINYIIYGRIYIKLLLHI